MPPPATCDEFVDLVLKSGVVDESCLQQHLQQLREQGNFPSEPSKLAGLLVHNALLTYFQADQLLQGKWKRFSIGKYKVLERLGTGGMGQVFLCEHKFMKRRVAVKVLPAAKAQDPASLERFYREARAVAALDHPNIVRAYDIDQDGGLHFLVMEYVDGTNLQDLVKKIGPLDITRACHYIYGAAVGLQHAHEMGLVHRDIKPGNILVDRSGVVKILDMGLAKFFHDDDDKLTKKYDENILGTADYLAPEQALDSHTVDIRADIYSLGATFYFLLTNQPLFVEGTVAQKLLWHQTREPIPLRSIRPDVPQDLADVVAKMMAKDPAQRFQVPAEVMAALTPWVMAPIAPPTERELPQFSRAAVPGSSAITQRNVSGTSITPSPTAGPPAGASGPSIVPSREFTPPPSTTSGSLVGVGKEIPPSTVGTQYTSSGPFPGAQLNLDIALSPPPDVVPPDAPTPQAPTPFTFTGREPVPQPGFPPQNPFDDTPPLTSDSDWGGVTDDADATANLAPTSALLRPKSSITHLAAPTVRPAFRRMLLIVGIAAACTLFALAGAAVIYLSGQQSTPPVPDGPPTWYVSKSRSSPNPERTLTTLRGIFEQVKSGDRIIILDDRLDEPPVTLNGRRGDRRLSDITIEPGTETGTVLWTPKLTGRIAQNGVLDLIGVESISVKGLIIDCAGKMPAGLDLADRCPGAVIDSITVRNPRSTGIGVYQAQGEPDRPILLRNCRVIANQKCESGISLIGTPVGIRSLRIENARIQGPGEAGLLVRGTVLDCTCENSRFSDWNAGILLKDQPQFPTSEFRLTVRQNTFFQVVAGVKLDAALASPKRELTLAKCYFGRTKEILAGVPPYSPVRTSAIARDKASTDGKLPVKATLIADFELSATQSADDDEFLTLPETGEIATFGAR